MDIVNTKISNMRGFNLCQLLFITGLFLIISCQNEPQNLQGILKENVGYSSKIMTLYGNGWYDEEPTGRWTEGQESKILFFTDGKPYEFIHVNGTYFGGANDAPYNVLLNDNLIGTMDNLPAGQMHTFSLPISEHMKKSGANVLIFKTDKPVQSVKAFAPESNDDRKIKFFLNSLILR